MILRASLVIDSPLIQHSRLKLCTSVPGLHKLNCIVFSLVGYCDIQGGPHSLTGTLCFVHLNFGQILTDFQTYFIVRIRRTFVIILSLKISPHLKCVVTLPCEMLVS